MYRILGLEPTKVQEDLKKIILQTTHPDDLERAIGALDAMLTDQQPNAIEYRVIWPDHSVHTLWAVPGEKVVDGKGKILKLSGIDQDITERKKHEREREAIVAVSAALRAAHTRDEMFPVIVEQVSSLLGSLGATIGLRDPVTGESLVIYANGYWTEEIGKHFDPRVMPAFLEMLDLGLGGVKS